MWQFIKYCLYCFAMVISAAFGNNPEGMNLKNCIVGCVTMFVLLFLAFGVLYLIAIIKTKILKK